MDSATPPSVIGYTRGGYTRVAPSQRGQLASELAVRCSLVNEPRSNLRYGPRCLGWSSVTVAPVFCRFRSQRAHGPLKKNFAPPRYCGSMTIEVSRVTGWLQATPHLADGRHIWQSCTGESVWEGRGVGGDSSTLPFGIVDPAASYRSGLSAALSNAGHAPVDVADPRAWASTAGRRVLLWTVRGVEDWKGFRALRGLNPELVLVALLVDPTPEAYAEALRSGAAAAVAWEAVPQAIVKVVAAALEGDVLIPAGVAQALAAKLPAIEDRDWITHEELEWLRILADGSTVHDLAQRVGYSERALYRLLHALYGRMGVSNRTEAILQASRRGLLD